MSQTGRNTGGMVDPAMGAGGTPGTPDDVVVEIEGKSPILATKQYRILFFK